MKKWYVLYVKMHHEKKVAQRFENRGTECFLPIQTIVRQWSDRKKKMEKVVIPRMLFVHVEDQERVELLQDPSAQYYLSIRGTGKPAFISDKEMERFMFMFDYSDTAIGFCTEQLAPGCMVRIVKGPLTGLEGELFQNNGRHEVAIRIPQLGYATIEVPVGYVSKIGD